MTTQNRFADATSFQFLIRVARTHNMGFAIVGIPCFVDTFVKGGSSVLRKKFSANSPRHRKPPKRYLQALNDNR